MARQQNKLENVVKMEIDNDSEKYNINKVKKEGEHTEYKYELFGDLKIKSEPGVSSSKLKVEIKREDLDVNDVKPYKCLYCDGCFKTDAKLKEHLVIHLVGDNCICRKCGKIFKRPDYCKEFMEVNTKYFICRNCGYTPRLLCLNDVV